MLFDVLRFAIFGMFGIGVGFMLMTNVLSFWLLRPPKRLGFLWWHVTSISVSFVLIGIVATESAVSRIGAPPSWRTFLTLVGMFLFAVAQFLIFGVERKRLVEARAARVVVASASALPGM